MNKLDIIKMRRSVRTFDGREISTEDRDKLRAYVETIENPYGIHVEFIFLDAKELGLSSPVIKGESLYIAAKVADVPHSEEAYGFAFEKMVLYAWSLGIGTTWIAASMKRDVFEKAAGTKAGEMMYCISPLGYPAQEMVESERKTRVRLHADERKPGSELFFDKNFSTPLSDLDADTLSALEAVRLAPSATNAQPWRIVKNGNSFHFYEKHAKALTEHNPWVWDVQKIDMGIALCYFMSIVSGICSIENLDISTAEDIEYIATVTI